CQESRRKDRFLLHEFVLMPDHFHILLTPAPEVSLEKAMQFIKLSKERRGS
ncbi:MAG: transposase, partial [Terriglobales bacterium]